ncbi:MAG: cation-translocating P-type ATPase [Bryobacterales bacterium]
MSAPAGAVRWHSLSAQEALGKLDSNAREGLAPEQARRRLAEHGRNEIPHRAGRSLAYIIAAQLRETLVLLLIAAAIISLALGDQTDAYVIAAIVVLNAALGARQEYKAEQAVEALAALSTPTASLRRGGHVVEVPLAEVAPGDIVLLEAGDAVPADCRLLEAASLTADESALTGESVPVEKRAQAELPEETPLAERRTMVYRGTAVAAGRGVALVVETGLRTELGHIANLLQSVSEERTPLQRRLDRLGRVLVAAALAVVAVVFVIGLAQGEQLERMFLTAVSLAVAAAPEGLPAVVTIALALGAQRMLARNALIRRLPAVESLGSVTVICSDKTGTLTENRMSLRTIEPVEPEDENGPMTRLALMAGALCSDAILEGETAQGDPTEVALIEGAARAGLDKNKIESCAPRVAEAPFDSERKRMATAHHTDGLTELPSPSTYAVFAKGALDAILEVCTATQSINGAKALDEKDRKRIETEHDKLAEGGMRVLALAWRPLEAQPQSGAEELEHDLIYVGLAGMLDPPRPEAAEAVATCTSAGVRTVMITGDHPKTAGAVAVEVGIPSPQNIAQGADVQAASDTDLEALAAKTSVYARVSPEDKLRIVAALQRQGEIVAMTGDGVNDAPALKRADVGVAMGVTGSDVAKEAADMVLRDDNFATIVAAVEEGRVIFDNVRKFIRYLLSANCGELWVMLAGPLVGMPTPLAPVQILWMNLITDGPPALALGVEPAENDVMRRPPAAPGDGVFSHGLGRDVLWTGLLMGSVSLAVAYSYWSDGLPQWQTMLFTTLTFSQMALALGVRSSSESFFRQGPWSNWALTLAVALSTGLQLAVVYAPPLQSVFETVALSARDLGVTLAAGACSLLAVEAEKAWRRMKTKRRG